MLQSKGEKTREHILKTTRGLLITQGFYNTSISDVLAATGVKKGNLYYYFGSKEDLGRAVLQDAKEEFFVFLARSFAGDTPIDKILHSCETIFAEHRKKHFVGGCLFGNTALEMSDNNPEFAKVIDEVFTQWTTTLTALLADAAAQRLLPGPIPPRLLAKTLIATMEGAIMMSRVSKDKSDLDDCLRALRHLLGR